MNGRIVDGSSAGGLLAKLDAGTSVEDVKLGNFAVVEGRRHVYFSLIADVKYQAVHPRFLVEAAEAEGLTRDVLWGTAVYPAVALKPSLQMERETQEIRPAKTLPEHGSPVRDAREDDVFQVFGRPSETHFSLGMPLELDVPVCVDLAKLVQRSAGVFGKAGTGKTFLTRLLLAGLVRAGAAGVLVFDAHNEYGWEGKSEGGLKVKGLKQLFPGRVMLHTLDPDSTRARGVRADGALHLAYRQITPEDILLLSSSLNLNPTAYESLVVIRNREGEDWFTRFMRMLPGDLEEYAAETGLHAGALGALRRKLERLAGLSFLREEVPYDAVETILDCLARGMHVVVEFGRTPELGYMLAANILTRRIHQVYVDRMERALASGRGEPIPLVIAIEEAHRFLDPSVSRETIFGTIARELRKYNVTLLVVDQRPSRIDTEVLSQIGTKVSCKLEDEADIAALLSGAQDAQALKNALATLDHKQQALIFGQALPMPVLVRTRSYDEAFYREVTGGAGPRGGGPGSAPGIGSGGAQAEAAAAGEGDAADGGPGRLLRPASAIDELFGGVEEVDL